jgi:hypothetical protein
MSTSTAATTAFAHTSVICGRWALHLDGNQKITAGNGTYDHPAPNALSTLAMWDCPGSTPSCRASCYVQGLAKAQPELYALYGLNSRAIREILVASPAQRSESARDLGRHIAQYCTGGFRWHVSGDIQSQTHAEWIVSVCRNSSHVHHWIYTRTFDPGVLDALTFASNLTVNLSADTDNLDAALAAAEHHGLRVCWMQRDTEPPPSRLERGDVIFPDYLLRRKSPQGAAWFASLTQEQRRMVCPVDYFGKSAHIRCGVCRKCL